MSNKPLSMGIILIATAFVLLLGKLGFFTMIWSLLWPLLLLVVPGVLLYLLVSNRTLPDAAIVLSGVLVTYGIIFFICGLFGWGSLRILWPGFIFGFAAGLYLLQGFQRSRHNSVRTAAVGLGVLSLLLLLISFVYNAGIYLFVFSQFAQSGLVGTLWSLLWPLLLVLLPGVLLHLFVFNRTLPAGALILGGILVVYGVFFFILSLFGWGLLTLLWPVFLLGIAAGLYELMWFERSRDAGLRTAALILAALSLLIIVFNLLFHVSVYLFIALLLAAGVLLVFLQRRRW
ncbi:hypothetical protein [Paenibacillus sp. FJAT-26967]|uniref:hypothetical protein n=1 Tax=Paenibacillus sp. FJAT-26967 TaxID=1729690 RepID=UPI0008398521|nr:hypothetical protein [Paenibacillus sp. FJAT-26967]